MKGLTIGQVAKLVGVTVKTIRHYHRKGLLSDPPRDGSGYRRYHSKDVLAILRARALAQAGIPLAEIAELLTQNEEHFSAKVDEIDRELKARIRRIQEQRDRLSRLRNVGPKSLPKHAIEILDNLQRQGFDQSFILAQRDSMSLAAILAPPLLESYVDQMCSRLTDSAHVKLMKRLWEASSWSATDPRLDELAREMAQNLLSDPKHLCRTKEMREIVENQEKYDLINHCSQLPAAAALTKKIELHLRRAGVDIPER